jgi:hypothetical protein
MWAERSTREETQMSKQFLRVGVLLAGAVITAVPAVGQTFIGVTANGGLTQFDMTAHTVTPLSTIHAGPNSPTGFFDLDYDGSGNLYAMRGFFDFNTFSTLNEFYKITNVNTGNALLSGSIAGVSGNPMQSLGYRSSNSTFYTVNGNNGDVVTIDPNVGAWSPVSGAPNGTPRNLVNALAVDPVDHMAYGLIDMGIPIIPTVDYTLIRMDLDTGACSIIGSLGQTADQFPSLRFDNSGNAYTVSKYTGNVYTVNLTTGAATFLFAGGAAATGTEGLALVNVPAPAGAGLLVLGGVVLSRRRRR